MPIWSAPVRFAECDQQGVVFNSHYLLWADEAVNAWFEQTGVRWSELVSRGLEHFVVASALEWRSSARWGETVEIDADLEKVGRTSLVLRFTVRVADRICCVIRTTYVCTENGASTPWPDDVRGRLTAA